MSRKPERLSYCVGVLSWADLQGLPDHSRRAVVGDLQGLPDHSRRAVVGDLQGLPDHSRRAVVGRTFRSAGSFPPCCRRADLQVCRTTPAVLS